MRKLYLCGGINGLTDAQCNDWRQKVMKDLAGVYEFRDPMRRDYRGREDDCAKEIVEGDLDDIKECDTLIVNAEKPSWGTAMELYHAHLAGKRIITVCPGRVSPWLQRHSTQLVRTLDEGVDWLLKNA